MRVEVLHFLALARAFLAAQTAYLLVQRTRMPLHFLALRGARLF
jgi:hypothetical protein